MPSGELIVDFAVQGFRAAEMYLYILLGGMCAGATITGDAYKHIHRSPE